MPASVTRARLPEPAPARSLSALRIGAQIRALRMAVGTSAGALAQTSGISASMLSRIERGLVSPSVETLDRVAQGLHVPISRFFGDQARRTDFCHVPAGQGVVVDRIGAVADYRYELLGHLLSGNLFAEPYLVTLLPDAEAYVTFQHPGLKFLYFLSGEVIYRYGTKVIEVKAGDSLLFDATALHGIEAIQAQPVSYLSVVFTLRE
ncbi:transcriptional regulator with XRE-family HTH domain [Variovorax boronicumulans]|uniref:helix-turn-helix domain-containing protein n=1 Tax=Variovorax boronicumulans TaxID=436515 RepID=UPI002475EB71|nr:XRE family transcriptional regulator [Variovorax boronicumulans]MDH6165529.1 transcriptional regulator with XRE-family HTH domain [Variovorax boronicumulans]